MNWPAVINHLLPELILLVGACITLVVGLSRTSAVSAFAAPLTLIIVLVALAAAAVQGSVDEAIIPGIWVTSLSHYARIVGLSVGALIVLVNWRQPHPAERGEYLAMLLLSLTGVLLTASANDLIVLFFAVELVSVPTYVMIALSRDDARASEATVKYFFLGALAAAVLAYGLSFLYGAAGSTTLQALAPDGAGLSTVAVGGEMSSIMVIGLLLTFGGLAFKIAAVPFHAYAPDVYEGAASPVTGMLGFVPKLAGFLALIKVLTAVHWQLPDALLWAVWLVAALTMTWGNVVALLQTNVKRILAYSSIAHTGYMLLALLVGPVAGHGPMRDGVAALLFYMAVYGVMNLGAFALLTCFRSQDNELETLDGLAGLSRRAPAAALGLAVCVFSLMGFPPTAGFLGKLYIFAGAFSVSDGYYFQGPIIALAIIAVVNTAIGAAYYLRIVSAAYVRPEVEPAAPAGGAPVRWALALCAIPMIVLFARPGLLSDRAQSATQYVRDAIQLSRTRVAEANVKDGESVTSSKEHEADVGHKGTDDATSATQLALEGESAE